MAEEQGTLFPGLGQEEPIPTHPNFKNLTGDEYNGIRVLRYAGRYRNKEGFPMSGQVWWCRCVCGQEFKANGWHLQKGNILKCPQCRTPSKFPPPPEKPCSRCKRMLPCNESFFPKKPKERYGYSCWCRECHTTSHRKYATEYLQRLRYEVLSHYSGGEKPFCYCCSHSTFEHLCLDHIEGSSIDDYKIHNTSMTWYRHIKQKGFPSGLRTACHNCNECTAHYTKCAHLCAAGEVLIPIRDGKPLIPPDVLPENTPIKACIKCHRLFPHSSDYFFKHKLMTSGLLNVCKECDRNDHWEQRRARELPQKLRVFSYYSRGKPACAICGCDILAFLNLDHINGGGSEHRRNDKVGNICRWIETNSYPEGYRVLCWNHNLSLGWYGNKSFDCVATKPIRSYKL